MSLLEVADARRAQTSRRRHSVSGALTYTAQNPTGTRTKSFSVAENMFKIMRERSIVKSAAAETKNVNDEEQSDSRMVYTEQSADGSHTKSFSLCGDGGDASMFQTIKRVKFVAEGVQTNPEDKASDKSANDKKHSISRLLYTEKSADGTHVKRFSMCGDGDVVSMFETIKGVPFVAVDVDTNPIGKASDKDTNNEEHSASRLVYTEQSADGGHVKSFSLCEDGEDASMFETIKFLAAAPEDVDTNSDDRASNTVFENRREISMPKAVATETKDANDEEQSASTLVYTEQSADGSHVKSFSLSGNGDIASMFETIKHVTFAVEALEKNPEDKASDMGGGTVPTRNTYTEKSADGTHVKRLSMCGDGDNASMFETIKHVKFATEEADTHSEA